MRSLLRRQPCCTRATLARRGAASRSSSSIGGGGNSSGDDDVKVDRSGLGTAGYAPPKPPATPKPPPAELHAAAAKIGLHIPKACGMGICGTCRVGLKSGEVEMDHNGGITEEDIEAYVQSLRDTTDFSPVEMFTSLIERLGAETQSQKDVPETTEMFKDFVTVVQRRLSEVSPSVRVFDRALVFEGKSSPTTHHLKI